MSYWNIDEIFLALKQKNNFTQKPGIKDIVIDSRKLKKGDLFIAIKGKNYDGHDFIEDAILKGASIVIGQKSKVNPKFPIIAVKNTKSALIDLAKYLRKKLKNLLIVGITGSSGKTTLKEWIHSILKSNYSSYCNYGNFNNDIGMPLTLCNLPKKTQICVLEMGMNTKGEIRRLANIARPNVSVITNIGSAHIGNLNDRKAIAEEKSNIFHYSEDKDYSIIPHEDDFCDFLKKKASKNTNLIFSFGEKKGSSFQFIKPKKNSKNVEFRILNKKINIPKKISFNSWENNIVIILGIIEILGLKIKNLSKKIEKLTPIEGRGKINLINFENRKIMLIDESYNSSPDSLKKSLENLLHYKKKNARIICIIGDMLELGKNTEKMHIGIVDVLKKVNPDIVFTVGKFTLQINKRMPESIRKFHFRSYKKVFDSLAKVIKNHDIVMVKGSNSSKVHVISKKLIESN